MVPARGDRPARRASTSIPVPELRKPFRALTTTKEIREALEHLKDEAVIHPTRENVRAYLEAQQYVMEKGSTFADMARRVVWETAELDYSLRRPTNARAIQRFTAERRETRERAIARLASESGLFFFFRGDCPYCHELAPILRTLQDVHGIEVFPVSLDGARSASSRRPTPTTASAACSRSPRCRRSSSPPRPSGGCSRSATG